MYVLQDPCIYVVVGGPIAWNPIEALQRGYSRSLRRGASSLLPCSFGGVQVGSLLAAAKDMLLPLIKVTSRTSDMATRAE